MKLLTVDLDSALPDIPPPSVGEQWVLVRFHREPVGILTFAGHGCSSVELSQRIADRCATRILRHLVADSVGRPDVSLTVARSACPRLGACDVPRMTVAVCTRNGADRLPECLDSLTALEYPAESLEILVVDNAPLDDRVKRLAEERYPSIRYVVEPRPGLDWARNRAVLESRGDVIAFTDDDVSVDRWWADAIGRRFASEPELEALTGLVVPDEIDVESQRLFEQYGGFARGFERRYFRVDSVVAEKAARRHGGSGKFGTGANMAYRRSLFARVGLFDPALDVGTDSSGGGDLEMFFRALKHGATLVYEPSAIVRHRHRRTYGELQTQLANNGIGFYAYLVGASKAYPDERKGFVQLGAWWFCWWNLRRLARSFIRPGEFPRDLILAELKGSISGLRRYARAKAASAEIEACFGPQSRDVSAANGGTS